MFRKTEEHVSFFRKLDDKQIFQIDFDLWYLCFFLGVVAGRKEQVGSARDMVAHFPEKYAGVENLLTAMLLRSELAEKGIAPTERAAVQQLVDQLINPSARPPLTSAGFKAFNEYAVGGYEIIHEELGGEPPEDSASFLIRYGQLLKGVIGKT